MDFINVFFNNFFSLKNVRKGKIRMLFSLNLLQISSSRPFTRFRERMFGLLNNVPKDVVISVDGKLFRLCDFESYFIVLPDFEKDILNELMKDKGFTFIDVGAHIGKYPVLLSDYAKKIYALEPNKINYTYLLHNIELNNIKNVVPLNVAAYSRPTKLKMYIGDSSGHHSIFSNYNEGYFEVDARPIDSLIHEPVDWIKIDVEGAECHVLQGAKQILSKYHPKLIVEVSSKNLEWVKKFLEKFDYKIKKAYNEGGYTNIVAY